MSEVAVVGAGIAGLATARRLHEAGQRVVVFEKARGVGGRLSTRRIEGGAFDHGAQYFSCRGGRLEARLADWLERGIAALWSGRIGRLEDGSLARWEEGERWVGVPGMSALARDLATGVELRLGRRVQALRRDDGGWRLALEDGGESAAFRRVLLSAPAPQTLALLEGASGLAAQVAEIGMSPCFALMLAYPRALDVPFDGAFVSDSPLSWVARNASKPGRPAMECWVAHASPEWSRRHLEAPRDELLAALRRAFELALALPAAEPAHAAVHRWLFARAPRALGAPFLWRPDEGVGLCGDWLSGERVQQAYESGAALAEAVLQTD